MEKVTRLESETGEIQNLKNEIQTLKLKMQRQENNIVASDLRINGVPYVENENLISIFNEICKVVNIEIPAIKSIFRLKNQNNKRDNNSPDAVIIVRMWSPYDTNFFLKILSSFKKANWFRFQQPIFRKRKSNTNKLPNSTSCRSLKATEEASQRFYYSRFGVR